MTKRERIAEELHNLRRRRDALNKRIEELEKKYEETENAEILGLVRSYDLTPEELAKLMARLASHAPGRVDREDSVNEKN